MQSDLAAVHNGFHGHGEILAASRLRTAELTWTLDFIGMIDHATVRAGAAFRPKQFF